MNWVTRFVGISIAASLLAACGGSSDSTNNTQNPPPPVPQCSDGVDNDGDGNIDLADAGCSDANDNDESDDPVGVGGLDARPSNLTCVAPDRAPPSGGVEVVDAFPNLSNIGQPTKILVEPVANPRWFVLQKTGQIRVFDPDNAVGNAATFLDLSGVVRTASEGGLLGMAFHPDYPTVPEIFLSYTIDNRPTSEMLSVFSRIVLDDVATPSPIGSGSVEQRFLLVEQFATNHNGGDIGFGADRLLYIGLGDGGGGNDPENTGQDTTNLLGAFLRIDVIGTGAGYDIPTGPQGNPFSDNAKCGAGLVNPNDCPEIYAWGVRNPWRWSFDAPTGVLWAGDVGQGAREEVDQIELGGNYGWDCMEGTLGNCGVPVVDPVAEYDRANGDRSITGGFVYRGSSLPALAGRYVFGDFVSGRIWALRANGVGGFDIEELIATGTNVSSFGIDQDGEVYYADYGGGRIMQLVAGGGGGADPVPDLLSQSGCVDPADITQPYSGLVPYDLNAPFWSDGAAKDRHLGLPNGTAISIDADDDWGFPPGTVTVKNFRLNGRLIETRHLMRHPDGEWAGYTYEWNAAGTEATRVRGGKTVNIDGQDWIYPGEAECLQCHTAIAGRALGPETAQLNKDFTYPPTGRTANQLATLDAISMFATPIGDPATLPALPDPFDPSADLGDRARAYLHTNCAQCHQPGGPTPTNLDLRYTTSLADTNACDAVPQAGGLGVMMPRIIAPGDASRSLLVVRTNRRDVNGMPPLGSTVVDAEGVALLTDWIDGLANCN